LNPPLVAYAQAAIASVAGFGEVALHLGALPWSLATALGAYELARRFCARPLLATLVFASAPAFLVSATTLGSDVPMLAAWLWAVVLWVRGLDRERPRLLAASALLCAVAALAKYFGASLLPLLCVYTLARERGVSRKLAWLALPALVLLLYELATARAYGEGLLQSAIGYAGEARVVALADAGPVWQRPVIGLLFAGGALVTPGFLAPLLWRRAALAALVASSLACALLVVAYGSLGSLLLVGGSRVRWSVALHVAFFAFVGVQVVALAVRDLVRERDADALLLTLGFAGALAFGVFFNWTVNARSLIVTAPLVAILTVRALDAGPAREAFALRGVIGVALAAGWSIGLAVTWADARQASSFERAAADLVPVECAAAARCWFLGHWGFQYYAQERGAFPVDLQGGELAAGDLLLVPENSSGSNRVPWEAATAVRERAEVPLAGISVQAIETRAAFHAAVRGPLPFVFGRAPPERFVLVRITRPLRGVRGELQLAPGAP
jgi:4-amino-4-deoxy-L-arabinose transferase-like glycosyltransferase